MKLLILSSSTGGGHDMRAYALRDWALKKGYVAEVFHPLERTSGIYKFGTKLYNWIQRRAPWSHSLYFKFLEHANLHRRTTTLLGKKKFISFLKKFKPNLIVSVHAHLNHAYLDLSKQQFPKCKFVIYCGELANGDGYSRHWINYKADLFTGPFETTCKTAIEKGMPKSKVKSSGLLLREAFYRNDNFTTEKKEAILSSMGINPTESFITLGTGANSSNNHLEIINALLLTSLDLKFKQIVALCGENEDLRNKLSSLQMNRKFKIIATPKTGAKEIASLFSNTACLLTRPGAGMCAEALACGTNVVFNLCGGIMPQETNNLNYWKSRNAEPIIIRSPNEFPSSLERICTPINVVLPSEPPLLKMIERIGNAE